MLKVATHNLADTHKLGEKIGHHLLGDETFALVAPLGGGKTSFTQGLAKGLGATARVTSPTFVLEKIYKGTKATLHHFDTYRIEASDVESTGLLDVLGEAVVVVEWADKIVDLLPKDAIWVTIKIGKGDERTFEFNYPDSRAYVFQK
jgi:tRNA threonylcarbamoyladenosine biosynthesis protein TsaE